jgi:hypothetical protein
MDGVGQDGLVGSLMTDECMAFDAFSGFVFFRLDGGLLVFCRFGLHGGLHRYSSKEVFTHV